ncbi:MAG: sigma-70 family RNA polymerase sigma factor [Bacteroidota bacterium]
MSTFSSNAALVDQLKAGNRAVIKELYRIAYPECASFIKNNNGTASDTEDFFQEALVVLYRKIQQPTFELTSNIKTFLYSINRNLWLNELRKRSKSGLKLVMDEQDDKEFVLTSEDEVAEKEETEKQYNLIAEMLQAVEGNCKEVLINFYHKKMSLKEIAAVMGFSEQYAKKRRYKCMQAFKKQVRERYETMRV